MTLLPFKALSMRMQVNVSAPARLHFGLLDLSGLTRRIDGGIGLTIQQPRLHVTVSLADQLVINAPVDFRDRCKITVDKLSEYLEHDRVNITLVTDSSPHVGLGSGTQSILAVGTALLSLVGRKKEFPPAILAGMLKRGGTSGIGVHAFAHGGLIVDGGRRWPDEKSEFGPGSQFSFSSVPPEIVNTAFPDWGICVALPRASMRIAGDLERLKFKSLTPVPLSEVEEACRLVLLGILPTVSTKDFAGFCDSMDEFKKIGFKRREIDSVDSTISYCMRKLELSGLRGVSMSAWGPSIFGFAKTSIEAVEIASILSREPEFLSVIATQADNCGALRPDKPGS